MRFILPLVARALLALALTTSVVTPSLATDADVAPPGVNGLAFMVGSWQGGHGGTFSEELWTAPRGGVMLGINRTVTSRGSQWEFLRIQEMPATADGAAARIVYWASPGGKEPTPFELVHLEENRAIFANPEHDFPQRIIYTRRGDRLHARVEAGAGDAIRGFDLEWQLATALD